MPNRELQSLLEPWLRDVPYCPLANLVLDSRQVAAGDLFIALPGHQCDGRHYIPQAIAQGAVAVLAEAHTISEEGVVTRCHGIPVIYLQNLPQHLSALAGRFYADEQTEMQLIGVTGTNGKTSTTHLIVQWCQQLGYRSSVMGTLGNGPVGQTMPGENTTGSAVEVQQTLADWQQQGVALTAMEVSSHGLVQQRVAALPFTVAVLTNVTRDHLDYHLSIEAYIAAKRRLFTEHAVEQKVINADDSIGQQWLADWPDAVAVSLQAEHLVAWPGRWLAATAINYQAQGTAITVDSFWGSGSLNSRLLGTCNVSNLLLALATLLTLGYPLPSLLATARQLMPICGRLEPLTAPGRPVVVIDYAHTSDALAQALTALRQHYTGRVWCVFGCGGDRDQGKRPLMGAVAEQEADQVILTTDNPRHENPLDIIQQILEGTLEPSRIQVIVDRSTAVASAVMQASKDDVVLIAGKGHETYQQLGSRRVAYSDRQLVAQLLRVTA